MSMSATERRLCEWQAASCYIRAKWSRNPACAADFLALERRWALLGESWGFVERLQRFIDATDGSTADGASKQAHSIVC
jgi:hypothetical protein